MKVKKSIVISCLLFALTIVLVSCKGEEKKPETSQEVSEETTKSPEKKEPENDNPYATAQNLVEDGCFYLGDYESLEQCLELNPGAGMRLTQNTDMQFVKHGKQSLKIELEGMVPGWSEPEGEPAFTIKSGEYFQKKDFTDCSKLIFEIYSAQEEDVLVWVDVQAQWACGYAFTVHHGWNTLEVETWRLNYTYTGAGTEADVDPTQSFAHEVNSIVLKFPKYSTFKGDTQLYYLDAVRAEQK